PGRKPTVEGGKGASAEKNAASDASKLAVGQNGSREPDDSQPEDAGARAARVAKRKRRKKKK
ncbi:MAG: hypothetical protein ACR2JR_09295, partial [Rubrobacteraceae bacterium]